MGNLYGVIGTYTPTALLADPQGADIIAVPCEPGNGLLLAGQVMYRKSNGMYAPATASDIVTTNGLVVLNEAIDTDLNMAVAEAAAAFRAGRLIATSLIVKGSDLTAAEALVLRKQGIVLEQMVDTAPIFENGRYTITYKANNGTTEADYLAYKETGATHTVLAFAATGFTAPDSKTFSKWNTAPDGSGTEYAAAASYTADADLVLYAIYA